MNNTMLIIRREYMERVRRKSFIITTLLMPIFMIAIMAVPTLMAVMSGPESRTIAIVDKSGVIAPNMVSDGDLRFVPVETKDIESLKASEDYDAVMVVGAGVVDNPSDITLYSEDAISMQTEEYITHLIKSAVENQRLLKYNIENLGQIMAEVNANVHIVTVNNEGDTTSSLANYLTGLVLMMILYMFIMLYGQMVMTSIVEEKNNRVLEVVVSSVKPIQLMLGKIFGVGAVAVTQLVIWAVLIFAFSTWGMPLITEGADAATVTNILGDLANTGHVMYLFGVMMLMLIGGYLFYSSIYAAIGSSVDNVQDASQLQSFAILPIILGMIMSFQAINDPFSDMAVWLSVIPFTSPLVMMARLPFGIPGWQIVLSVAVLAVSVWFMIWLSAKIYRVGIFMYGKKPTFTELIRWARYN